MKDNDLLHHIGKKIKLYRKAKLLNIEDLAIRIGKSKSTVSKYENGKIPLDIKTLYDISKALQVDLIYLIDYNVHNKLDLANKLLLDTDLLYLYHFHANKIYLSVIKVLYNPICMTNNVTLHFKTSPQNYYLCSDIYHGTMHCFDTVTNISFESFSNPVDKALINFVMPLKKSSIFTGIMSGIGDNPIMPVSYKVVISKTILKHDNNLFELLVINKKEIKDIKNKNILTAYPNT